MSAGYDPFYWLDRELNNEYEKERESENDKKRINKDRRNTNTSECEH